MDGSYQISEFGRFRLDPVRRILTADGEPIHVNPRGFDILRLLIELRGRVVTKDEIMDRVWEGTIVEENNLAVQISALRRTLGKWTGGHPLIVTIPGKGYRFVGEVVEAVLSPDGDRKDVPGETGNAEASTAEVHLADTVTVAEPSLIAAPAPVATVTIPESRRPVPWRIIGAGVIVAIIGAGALTAYLAWRSEARPAPRLSIVVLPFRNLSDDPEQNYLADAVSDDLTTDLSQLPGSFVIARESADAYKGRQLGASQVGQELGVRYLLEGSVRRADEKIIINAQLIDTETGAHLWADRFDALRAQMSEAQAAIVRRIGSALNIELVRIEGQRSMRDRPNNPDTMDLFLRARSIADRNQSLEGLASAQALLEQAIAQEPEFVDALSELASLSMSKVMDYDDATVDEDVDVARTSMTHALEIAPQNALALAARGDVLASDRSYPEASASYRLALSIDPNNIPARMGLAREAYELGRPEETVSLIQEVLRLDPRNPRNRFRYQRLGQALLLLGRDQEAIEALHQDEAGEPNPMEYNQLFLIAANQLVGRTMIARDKYESFARLWPHRTAWRLACFATKAEAALPGFKRIFTGLEAAGMPAFADEEIDDAVVPSAEPRGGGDFQPTPLTAPGTKTVVTADVVRLVADNHAAFIVDVGRGAAVIPGALWLPWVENDSLLSAGVPGQFKQDIESRTHADYQANIIVMGSGTYGWTSYNAALALVVLGYRHVLWYRGGEEAWAKTGQPSEDDRNP